MRYHVRQEHLLVIMLRLLLISCCCCRCCCCCTSVPFCFADHSHSRRSLTLHRPFNSLGVLTFHWLGFFISLKRCDTFINLEKARTCTRFFPENPSPLKVQWTKIQNLKENALRPRSIRAFVRTDFFTEDSFEQNFTVRSLLGLSFKPRRLAFKKEALATIFNLPMESPQLTDKQRTKNKQIMLSEQRANSSAISRV